MSALATGAISRGQLDSARSQRDQTQAQVRATREQLGQLETGYRPEEIAQSDAQLQGQSGVGQCRARTRRCCADSP